MGKVIPVSVRDKIAKAPDDALYICGNSDFTIVFEFDDEWDAYETKTARFRYNGTFEDVVFSGNECPVPVISDTYNFTVGVFAGNLHTTTAAYVSAKKSVLCEGGLPARPKDDVYAQIMEKLNSLKADVPTEQIAQAVTEYMEAHPMDGVTQEELAQAVTDALTQAKESGEFDGAPGKNGADGKDGTSVTHSWSGTTLTVNSASGTSSADLKGEKGDTGADGKDYVLTESDKQEIAGMVEVTDGGVVDIDDTTPSTTTTYSSEKIEQELNTLNEAKANDADLAAVAKSGSYNDLTDKPTIPTVPSSLPNPNALTFTGAVEETYDGSAPKSVEIHTVPESLKNPYKLKLTGAVTAEYDGSSEVSVEIPAGGGSAYELPIASSTQLGGVQPVAKTEEMTQPVGVDALGALFTAPGGGVGWDGKWRLIKTISVSADVSQEIFSTDDNGNEFSLTEILIYASQLPSMNSGYLYVRYMNAEGFHSNNNCIWPSNGKTLKWYLSIRDSLLKTDIAISDNKIIGEYDTASMSADSIERMAVGASAGFTEDGTIYVYGR